MVSNVKQKPGAGDITATAKDESSFTAKAYVEVVDSTVSAPKLSFINLSDTMLSLYVGGTANLTVTGYPTAAFDKASIVWSTEDDDIAVVANRKVTALKAGETNIVATVTGTNISQKCKVVVSVPEGEPVPTQFVLSESAIILTKGEMHQLTLEFVPSNTVANVLWSSSNVSVATVNQSGRIETKSPGTATITVSNSTLNLNATCEVTVKAPSTTAEKTSSITFAPAKAVLAKGDTIIAKAAGYPVGLADNFTFVTSDDNVAHIEPDTAVNTIRVNAVNSGTATITAVSTLNPLVKATLEITVLKPEEVPTDNVTSIAVNPGSATVYIGKMASFIATPYELDKKS